MDEQKQQLIGKLQQANNILVTVSNDPSVDQLAACIAMTLLLNKLDKHATAVFSGEVPNTIEFLKPEETIEKDTNSLRDFIIALDKSKADKLRYKVEDKVVKIFITPYHTSLSENDLEFSQGDFNVDVVLALGVKEQQQLDQAITTHGRILHDATVISVNNTAEGGLGSINLHDPAASSLSEIVTSIAKDLGPKLLDQQIATALLTGIVAATDRFRDDNTTALTMNTSADLMAAGANQQLVTSELEHSVSVRDKAQTGETPDTGSKESADETPKRDGTLEIDHETDEDKPGDFGEADSTEEEDLPLPPPQPEPEEPKEPEKAEPKPEPPVPPQPQTPAEPPLPTIGDVKGDTDQNVEPGDVSLSQGLQDQRDVMKQPPMLDTPLTANTTPQGELEPALDTLGSNGPTPTLLMHDRSTTGVESGDTPPLPAGPTPTPADTPLPPASTPLPTPTPNPLTTPIETPASPLPAAAPLPSPFSSPAVDSPSDPLNPLPTSAPFGPAAPTFTAPEPGVSNPVSSPSSPLTSLDNSLTPTVGPLSADGDADVDEAREEVMRAFSEQPADSNAPLPPVAALNAQPLGDPLHQPLSAPSAPLPPQPTVSPIMPPAAPTAFSGGLNIPPPQTTPPTNAPGGPTLPPPPPVPPPMMPPLPQ
jgi:hypothetical protein